MRPRVTPPQRNRCASCAHGLRELKDWARRLLTAVQSLVFHPSVLPALLVVYMALIAVGVSPHAMHDWWLAITLQLRLVVGTAATLSALTPWLSVDVDTLGVTCLFTLVAFFAVLMTVNSVLRVVSGKYLRQHPHLREVIEVVLLPVIKGDAAVHMFAFVAPLLFEALLGSGSRYPFLYLVYALLTILRLCEHTRVFVLHSYASAALHAVAAVVNGAFYVVPHIHIRGQQVPLTLLQLSMFYALPLALVSSLPARLQSSFMRWYTKYSVSKTWVLPACVSWLQRAGAWLEQRSRNVHCLARARSLTVNKVMRFVIWVDLTSVGVASQFLAVMWSLSSGERMAHMVTALETSSLVPWLPGRLPNAMLVPFMAALPSSVYWLCLVVVSTLIANMCWRLMKQVRFWFDLSLLLTARWSGFELCDFEGMGFMDAQTGQFAAKEDQMVWADRVARVLQLIRDPSAGMNDLARDIKQLKELGPRGLLRFGLQAFRHSQSVGGGAEAFFNALERTRLHMSWAARVHVRNSDLNFNELRGASVEVSYMYEQEAAAGDLAGKLHAVSKIWGAEGERVLLACAGMKKIDSESPHSLSLMLNINVDGSLFSPLLDAWFLTCNGWLPPWDTFSAAQVGDTVSKVLASVTQRIRGIAIELVLPQPAGGGALRFPLLTLLDGVVDSPLRPLFLSSPAMPPPVAAGAQHHAIDAADSIPDAAAEQFISDAPQQHLARLREFRDSLPRAPGGAGVEALRTHVDSFYLALEVLYDKLRCGEPLTYAAPQHARVASARATPPYGAPTVVRPAPSSPPVIDPLQKQRTEAQQSSPVTLLASCMCYLMDIEDAAQTLLSASSSTPLDAETVATLRRTGRQFIRSSALAMCSVLLSTYSRAIMERMDPAVLTVRFPRAVEGLRTSFLEQVDTDSLVKLGLLAVQLALFVSMHWYEKDDHEPAPAASTSLPVAFSVSVASPDGGGARPADASPLASPPAASEPPHASAVQEVSDVEPRARPAPCEDADSGAAAAELAATLSASAANASPPATGAGAGASASDNDPAALQLSEAEARVYDSLDELATLFRRQNVNFSLSPDFRILRVLHEKRSSLYVPYFANLWSMPEAAVSATSTSSEWARFSEKMLTVLGDFGTKRSAESPLPPHVCALCRSIAASLPNATTVPAAAEGATGDTVVSAVAGAQLRSAQQPPRSPTPEPVVYSWTCRLHSPDENPLLLALQQRQTGPTVEQVVRDSLEDVREAMHRLIAAAAAFNEPTFATPSAAAAAFEALDAEVTRVCAGELPTAGGAAFDDVFPTVCGVMNAETSCVFIGSHARASGRALFERHPFAGHAPGAAAVPAVKNAKPDDWELCLCVQDGGYTAADKQLAWRAMTIAAACKNMQYLLNAVRGAGIELIVHDAEALLATDKPIRRPSSKDKTFDNRLNAWVNAGPQSLLPIAGAVHRALQSGGYLPAGATGGSGAAAAASRNLVLDEDASLAAACVARSVGTSDEPVFALNLHNATLVVASVRQPCLEKLAPLARVLHTVATSDKTVALAAPADSTAYPPHVLAQWKGVFSLLEPSAKLLAHLPVQTCSAMLRCPCADAATAASSPPLPWVMAAPAHWFTAFLPAAALLERKAAAIKAGQGRANLATGRGAAAAARPSLAAGADSPPPATTSSTSPAPSPT